MGWCRWKRKPETESQAELEAAKDELAEMTAAHAELQAVVGELPTHAPKLRSAFALRDYPKNVVAWLQTWWGGALWVLVPSETSCTTSPRVTMT